MSFAIAFGSRARRELSKLDKQIAERASREIDMLAYQPRPPACKKLVNEKNLWRIRVGDYRIVYQVHDDQLIILVVRVGHRREIYD